MSVLKAEGVRKTYQTSERPVEALRDVSLTIEAGEFVAVMGPSGCGKSTLLHLCGAMDRPTAGRVLLQGVPLADLDDEALTRVRRERVGFVFQFFNLLPTLSVLENMSLPLLLTGVPPGDAAARAQQLARRLGLGSRLGHHPRQLSGGEAQRAAIGRAIIHHPTLLVADEPTGNLDSASGAMVLELLGELHRETGVTLLLATHAKEVANAASRIVHMRDGRIEREAVGLKTKADEP